MMRILLSAVEGLLLHIVYWLMTGVVSSCGMYECTYKLLCKLVSSLMLGSCIAFIVTLDAYGE